MISTAMHVQATWSKSQTIRCGDRLFQQVSAHLEKHPDRMAATDGVACALQVGREGAWLALHCAVKLGIGIPQQLFWYTAPDLLLTGYAAASAAHARCCTQSGWAGTGLLYQLHALAI